MSVPRTPAVLRLLNWIAVNRTTQIILSVLLLVVAALSGYYFWTTHKAIFAISGVFMVFLVVRNGLQHYQHRDDPDWPPQLRFVSSRTPENPE